MALYAKPRRISKLFKTVKEYATEHEIKCFSLDAAGRTFSQGNLWNFGITYVDNSANWISILKEHCTDEERKNHLARFGDVKNIDWFFNFIKSTKVVRIETFYVENLQLIHNNADIYSTPIWGVRYWANGRCHWPAMINEFGMGNAGSMPIPADIIKFDIGFTLAESRRYVKTKSNYQCNLMLFECANKILDSEITIILPLDGNNKNVQLCLDSLYTQIFDDNKLSPTIRYIVEKSFKAFRLIVTDAGLNETALKTCREMENKFDGRMKIITGLSKENLFSAGLQAAKSRYVIFINGNDVFVPDTFKFLHDVAENIRADIVHTSNYFVPNEGKVSLATDEVGWDENLQTIINLRRVKERIDAWANGALSPSIYNKLIRREFLEEEKISIPFNAESSKWTFSLQCLLLSENYVRVPQPLYMRMFNGSRNVEQENFETNVKSKAAGLEAVDKIIDEVLYFDEYANEKKLVKEMFLRGCW